MKDEQCVRFLQWALPHLQMRWPGFRKVRRQVCRRIQRRIRQLDLAGVSDYQDWLATHRAEWTELDALCRITISRFFRDREVFAVLEQTVMPALAEQALERGASMLHVWSAGCASGEEPYSIAILWALKLRLRVRRVGIRIVATEADADLICRAHAAQYRHGSIKGLPVAWLRRSFRQTDGDYTLKPELQRSVEFREQDIRRAQPDGPFDLVLCRNLAFTYFDEPLQRDVLKRIVSVMHDGGALVIGAHEKLPDGFPGLSPWPNCRYVYRKSGDGETLL